VENALHKNPKLAAPPGFEELAAQQGVRPINDVEILIGRPSEEDESTEDFIRMLRGWRNEGRRGSDGPQCSEVG
jgi:hypothetical protein